MYKICDVPWNGFEIKLKQLSGQVRWQVWGVSSTALQLVIFG